MDEQMQEQFIQWLAQKLGVSSEEELSQALEQMGDEGVQQAMTQFQSEMGQQQPSAAAYLHGGKMNYIKSLNSFMKGGKIKQGSKDGKSALGLTMQSKKKDAMSAKKPGNRKEPGKNWMTARTTVKK